jgi:dihydropteroate synthase
MGNLAGSKYPVLAGLSRKSLIAHIHQQLGEVREVSQRLPGSLALAMIAADNHAAIIRVHDVRETVDALKVRAAYRAV